MRRAFGRPPISPRLTRSGADGRMVGETDKLLLEWVGAGADRPALEARLAELMRPIAFRAARSYRLEDADADDVAQRACQKILAFLQNGQRIETNADAFVWRTAENLARDLLRSRKRAKARADKTESDTVALAEPETPETRWLELEEREAIRERVRTVIDGSPYEDVLRPHYIEEVSVEELADKRFRELVAQGNIDESDPVAAALEKRRARNLIDQRLKRGRIWLRKRLEKAAHAVDE